MNTAFESSEIGKEIGIKLEQYELNNDPKVLWQKSLITKIGEIAKFVIAGGVFLAFVASIASSSCRLQTMGFTFAVSLGVCCTARIIGMVFERVLNLHDFYPYSIFLEIKKNWCIRDKENFNKVKDLRIKAGYYIADLAIINSDGSIGAPAKWIRTQQLNFSNYSYNVAKFLGITVEETHAKLKELEDFSSKIHL